MVGEGGGECHLLHSVINFVHQGGQGGVFLGGLRDTLGKNAKGIHIFISFSAIVSLALSLSILDLSMQYITGVIRNRSA